MSGVRAALLGAAILPAALVLAPPAHAAMQIGHYNAIIEGRLAVDDAIAGLMQRPLKAED